MIDPPQYVRTFIEGDEGVLPTPTGGEWADLPDENYEANPFTGPPKMFDNYYRVVAQNAKIVITAKDRPDYWIVKLDSTAGTRVNIYPAGGDVFGEPIPIEATEHYRIAGLDYSITLLGVSATAANVSVVAVRGYDLADL